MLNEALGELHHAAKVSVGLIKFEHGELGIMTARESLVTKDAADLKDAIFASYEHPLKVEL